MRPIERADVSRRLLITGVMLAVAIAASCKDAPDRMFAVQPEEPPGTGGGATFVVAISSVSGDWMLTSVRETRDTCGFSLPSGITAGFELSRSGRELVSVVEDSMGDCDSFRFSRSRRSASGSFSRILTDDCTVRVDTTFIMEFSGSTFTATEENRVTYLSGDCGTFDDDCDWSLAADGSRCVNCALACPDPTPPQDRKRIGGPLGWSTQRSLADLVGVP